MARITEPIITDTTGQRIAAAVENIKSYMEAYTQEESDARYDRTSTWEDITLLAASWNSETGVYSLETTYPNATYDILGVLPTDATTDAMLEAWAAANCGGYHSTNIIKARGTVPTIDISMKINVRYKGTTS